MDSSTNSSKHSHSHRHSQSQSQSDSKSVTFDEKQLSQLRSLVESVSSDLLSIPQSSSFDNSPPQQSQPPPPIPPIPLITRPRHPFHEIHPEIAELAQFSPLFKSHTDFKNSPTQIKLPPIKRSQHTLQSMTMRTFKIEELSLHSNKDSDKDSKKIPIHTHTIIQNSQSSISIRESTIDINDTNQTQKNKPKKQISSVRQTCDTFTVAVLCMLAFFILGVWLIVHYTADG